jgi:cytochrome P450
MGIRGCPGQRIAFTMIKMIAANLALRYDLTPMRDPPHQPCFERNLMLPVTPQHIYISFKRVGAACSAAQSQ